jgi:hypothetical protein
MWNVITDRDSDGNPLYTATCDTHLAALLDHKAQSNTVLSVYVGGAVDVPADSTVTPTDTPTPPAST